MTRDGARPRRGGGASASGFLRLVAHTDAVALVGITLSITLSVLLDLTGAASGVESLRLDALTNAMPRASGELSWWRSEIGRRYWEANVEALRLGVRITRVFVYATLTDEVSDLAGRQRAAGARVGLLPFGAVGPHLLVNLTLWDSSSWWEARMTAHGEIGENQFSVNRADVERLTRVFDACASVATFEDPTPTP
ncbi:hypothetical protein ACLQ25_29135 [Micromonospora sp. DT44]|uniref:hypothetical protein n=1 Tax=Micromonospora sp. DT44 TaxID=3393439 RepID=UPI003CEC1EEC